MESIVSSIVETYEQVIPEFLSRHRLAWRPRQRAGAARPARLRGRGRRAPVANSRSGRRRFARISRWLTEGRVAPGPLRRTRCLTDWSNYVADAGSDPWRSAERLTRWATPIADAQPVLESIDTSALPEDAAAGVTAAQDDTTTAASWDNGARAISPPPPAGRTQPPTTSRMRSSWPNSGDMDGAQEWLAHASTDSDIGDTWAGTAQSDLGIGAEYMDTASADLSSAVDTTSYDIGSTDTGSVDTGSVDTSSDAEA